MHSKETQEKQESLSISINGRRIRLFFSPEPNPDAAELIKRTLLSAYLLKAV